MISFFFKKPALLLYEPQEGSRQTDRNLQTKLNISCSEFECHL